MARREATVVIDAEGRDNGKVFTLREMPTAQAEEWFARAMMLIVRSGADVPPNIFQQGAMGFAAMGLGALLTGIGKAPWHEVKPLLDEMMGCVVAMDSPAGPGAQITMSSQIAAQIEEVATLMQLREEVLSLHLGFSLRAKLSAFRSLVAGMISMEESGLNTSTSLDPSQSSSQAAMPN